MVDLPGQNDTTACFKEALKCQSDSDRQLVQNLKLLQLYYRLPLRLNWNGEHQYKNI